MFHTDETAGGLGLPREAESQLDELTAAETPVTALCDRALRLITTGQSFAAFRFLGPPLSLLYESAAAAGRKDRFIGEVRRHPLFETCQQDPYTARAFRKPRGYAGDAVMMDFVYSGRAPAGTSPLGQEIFQATTRVPMGLSVLYRRALLQSTINDTIARQPSCRILSVASGHCREVEDSLLFKDGVDCEFIALDQDPETSTVVAREFAHPRLQVLTERVRSLVFGRLDLGQFDLIYSAGLYDYLPDATAMMLTARLHSMLKPGGRLLIANFLRSSYGRGYLEAFMDWQLQYRSEDDVRSLFPDEFRNRVKTSIDPHQNVVYAQLTR